MHAGRSPSSTLFSISDANIISALFVDFFLYLKLMEQIRNQAQASTPSLFVADFLEEPPLKIGTEVFDCTMPSELEFDDEEASTSKPQNSKGEFSIFENRVEEEKTEGLATEEPS
jgi:hypothetical protein